MQVRSVSRKTLVPMGTVASALEKARSVRTVLEAGPEPLNH